jgi:four helix bundle protein
VGRLKADLLARVESYADRMLDVAESLAGQRRFRRVTDQISGCGTSVGANTFEADQAITRKDFIKTLSITAKELSESRFWLRLISRRGWIKPERLDPLLAETEELLAITNAMILRSRKATPRKRATPKN